MKLIHQDDDSYVLKHPSGHTLTLKKASMSPEEHQAVMHLEDGGTASTTQAPVQIDPNKAKQVQDYFRNARHFEDGGTAPYDPKQHTPEENMARTQDEINTAKQNPSMVAPPKPSNATKMSNGGGAHAQFNMTAPENLSAPATQPSSGQAVSAPAQAGADSPAQNPDLMQQFQQSTDAENQAEQQLGQSNAQVQQAASQALGQEQPKLDKLSELMEQAGQQYHKAWDNIANNTNPTIDPHHIWGDKLTPNKIASAIGLLFSGAALGIGGHADLAFKAVNDTINRDIDAQKATFSNKDNLLRQYSDMYKDTNMGLDALRAQYGAQVENQIKRAAAQAGTPQAMAAAQVAIQKNRQNMLGSLSNLASGQANIALSQYKENALQPGQQNAVMSPSGIDYDQFNKLKISGLMPKEDIEAATKEATQYENNQKQSQVINKTFDDAAKDQHLGNRIKQHGGFEPPSVGAFQNLLAPYLRDSEGRVNEVELKRADKFIPRVGDSDATIAYKRQALNQFLQEKSATPTLDRYNLRQQIQMKNGVPYKKVQGGWQRVK